MGAFADMKNAIMREHGYSEKRAAAITAGVKRKEGYGPEMARKSAAARHRNAEKRKGK